MFQEIRNENEGINKKVRNLDEENLSSLYRRAIIGYKSFSKTTFLII
jgi:hypothetical protein